MLPGRATVLLPHTVIQTVCVEMLPGRAYPYGTVCDRVVVAARLATRGLLRFVVATHGLRNHR